MFARTDWEYVFNTFSYGYALGYHFIQTKSGACNGNFLGIGADMAVRGGEGVGWCRGRGWDGVGGGGDGVGGGGGDGVGGGGDGVGEGSMLSCMYCRWEGCEGLC